MTDHEVADETEEEPGPDTVTDSDPDRDDSPPDGRDRLEALQEDIDEVRRRVADPTDQGENKFIEEGEADEDQPVDDTIVPPG